MVEKMKTDADKLLLVLKMEKFFKKYFVKLNCFSFSKPNVVYLRLFSSSLPFLKVLKQNFTYFVHKHVEMNNNVKKISKIFCKIKLFFIF